MKKGFTLIELLAVIVILAIIALIATPIILNIVNDTRVESDKRSIDNIIHTAVLYYSKTTKVQGNIYKEVVEMIDGKKPDNGVIYVNKDGKVAMAIKYGDTCYKKEFENEEVTIEKTDECIAPVNYLMLHPKSQSGDTTFLGNSKINRNQVEKIEIKDKIEIPEGAYNWDVSDKGNNSVMAWYVDSDENGLYELYIGQEGGVIANPDSSYLFNYFINVKEMNLQNLDTSNVTKMNHMFNHCESLTNLNLSHFNTSEVTNMKAIFQMCINLESLDISGFNTENVNDMAGMFNKCNKLSSLDLSHFNTSKVTTMRYVFNECLNLTSLNLSKFNTSNVEDMYGMFLAVTKLKNLDLSHFNTSKVTTMHAMFAGMSSLTSLDLSSFETSYVTDMSYMFGTFKDENGSLFSLSSLENLDISHFDTSKVTTMNGMFNHATRLKTINMKNATFTKVTNVEYMFNDTPALTSIIVEDDDAKTWLETRLSEVGSNATVSKPQ